MQIKAADVKSLREKTGAGMMDCKKALVEAQGDFGKAEKILKELGLAAADKRVGRATNEGRIFSRVSENRGVLMELSCETDFVARNEDFIALGDTLLDAIFTKNLKERTAELEDIVRDTMSRIKENMSLKRLQSLEADGNEAVVDYIHVMDQGWLRDEKSKTSKILAALNNEIGGEVQIKDFLYFKVGLED
jgi:elongation factor Ts